MTDRLGTGRGAGPLSPISQGMRDGYCGARRELARAPAPVTKP